MTDDIRSEAHPSHHCPDCMEYAERRLTTVLPEIVGAGIERDADPKVILGIYMRGIHDRHMSGLSLEVAR